MPEFLFRWIKMLIYYLNLLFGNIKIVKILKSFLNNMEQPNFIFYFLPMIVALLFAFVVVLILVTRLFRKQHKEAVWIKKR